MLRLDLTESNGRLDLTWPRACVRAMATWSVDPRVVPGLRTSVTEAAREADGDGSVGGLLFGSAISRKVTEVGFIVLQMMDAKM